MDSQLPTKTSAQCNKVYSSMGSHLPRNTSVQCKKVYYSMGNQLHRKTLAYCDKVYCSMGSQLARNTSAQCRMGSVRQCSACCAPLSHLANKCWNTSQCTGFSRHQTIFWRRRKNIPDKKFKFNWEFFWAPGKQDQRETTYGHQSSVL